MKPTFHFEVLGVTADTTTKVVKSVRWRYNATVDGKTLASTLGELALLPPPEGATLVPFESVKYEDIAGWVVQSMGGEEAFKEAEAQQQADLLQQIAEQEVVTQTAFLPPPWAKA